MNYVQNVKSHADQAVLLPALHQLIADHGPLRTLLALLRALLQRHAKPPPAAMLSNHLRRDIGLDDLPPPRSHVHLRP